MQRERYAASGIDSGHPPPTDLRRLANDARWIFASDMRRSIESADMLGTTDRLTIDPIFREIIPPANILPALKLPVWAWLVIGRASWLMGCARNCETRAEARARSEQAADLLEQEALRKDNIMLIGHDWFNTWLRWALQRRGWRLARRGSASFWGTQVLSRK